MAEAKTLDNSDLCLVTAVEIEFKLAVALLTERHGEATSPMKLCRGRVGRRAVTVLQTEIGSIGLEERMSEHLTNHRYDALIIAGLAGGLDPKLRVGDAVVYDRCFDARNEGRRPVGEEAASLATDDRLSGWLLSAATGAGRAWVRGAGVTADGILTEASDKLRLGACYQAAAVDMETYAVLSVCTRLKLPAAVLRVISDEANQNLPDFNRGYEADGRINAGRMALALAARPLATLRFLLRLRGGLRALQCHLAAALKA